MVMAKSIRTTVSVPEELYAALAKAAESRHVSTAWVIRDALRLYLGEQDSSPNAVGRGPERARLIGEKVKNT